MADLDQTIDRIAAENSKNRHQDLALGTAEAGFAIALAIWIAAIFSPPISAPETSAIIILLILVLARRVASDWWFQRSERLGQESLTDYRSSFLKQSSNDYPPNHQAPLVLLPLREQNLLLRGSVDIRHYVRSH